MRERISSEVPNDECNGQSALKFEFTRLKRLLGVNDDLELRWLPNGRRDLSGEVRKTVIFIYDSDYETAVRTLRHELIDYLVSKAIEPYKEITNKLIPLWNEEAYRKKEVMVERLSGLLEFCVRVHTKSPRFGIVLSYIKRTFFGSVKFSACPPLNQDCQPSGSMSQGDRIII